jgi:hypothetical protein
MREQLRRPYGAVLVAGVFLAAGVAGIVAAWEGWRGRRLCRARERQDRDARGFRGAVQRRTLMETRHLPIMA